MVIAAMKLKDTGKKSYDQGRKAMTNLDSILESRDATVPTGIRLVKAVFFFSSHV